VPALVGPFVGFALGVALAWLCRVEALREDEAGFRARVLVAALFGALVFAPACAYFLAFAGDWSLFYLVDSRAVPSAALLILAVVDAALVAAGFVAGHRAARRRQGRALVALAVTPAVLAGVTLLAFFSRLRVEGTTHQVASRFGTQPLAGSPLGWAVLWMLAVVTAGFVVAARALVERPGPVQPAAPADGPAGAAPTFLGRKRR
jgi:hypothetical protein